MKAAKEDMLKRPFVMTEADIKKMAADVGRITARALFKIECSDGVKREFHDVNELIAYENPPKRQIKKLSIIGHSQDALTTVSLRFNFGKFYNLSVDIEGEEDEVLSLWEALDERLDAMRPWYHWVARINFIYLLCVISFAYNALFISYVLITAPKPLTFSLRPLHWHDFATFQVLLSLSPLPVGICLNVLRNAFFPRSVFAIGQGLKRHEDKNLVRTLIVLAFVVSLAASLLAPLIIK